MGRYIDWKDVATRYQDAAKIVGAEGMGSYWLNFAEAEVDAALSPRYTVPFSTPPVVVQDLCIDLTYYKLTQRQKNSEALITYVNSRLGALRDGDMELVGADGVLLGQDALPWSSTQDHETSFGLGDPLDFAVDTAGWAP